MLNAFFDWFARALVGWVLLALGIGYFFPQAFALLPGQATNYFFALTMFGIGALLAPGDFAVILKRPVPIFLSACIVGALIIWRHRDNLQRLLAGTESRFGKTPPAA